MSAPDADPDLELAFAWGLESRRRGAVRMFAIGAIVLIAGLVFSIGPGLSSPDEARRMIRLRIFGGVLAVIGAALTAIGGALWLGARRATRRALTPDLPTAIARPRK